MKLIESNNLAPELANQISPGENSDQLDDDVIEAEIEEISPGETP